MGYSRVVIVFDVDTLVCCAKHMHAHGNCIPDASDIRENSCIPKLLEHLLRLSYVVEGLPVTVVVNGDNCRQNFRKIVERVIEVVRQCDIRGHPEELADICSAHFILMKTLNNIKDFIYDEAYERFLCKPLRKALSLCLEVSGRKDCETIEARVDCIIRKVCSGSLCGSGNRATVLGLVFCYGKDRFRNPACKHVKDFTSCSCKNNADVHGITFIFY